MSTRGVRFAIAGRRVGASLAALAACGALLTAACASEGPPRGSLMVVVDTNVTPGRDFDVLRVRVQDDPATEIAYRYGWDEAAQRASVEDGGHLPFTVNVQNAGDTLAARKISVTAWKAGAPVFARDAELVLPSAGAKALRLTVEALCFPQLAAEEAKPAASAGGAWAVASRCGAGQTCFGGSCAPAHVDVSALEDYALELLYGGASGPGQGGACMDALGCFTRRAKEDGSLDEARLAQVVTPRRDGELCVIDAQALLARDEAIVAVEVPESLGTCAGQGCLVALDRLADRARGTGWFGAGGRIFLPPRVCALGLRVWVATSPAPGCSRKAPGVPACAEWSSQGSGTTPQGPANRAADLVFEEGVNDVVCAHLTPSTSLCAAASVGCGKVLAMDAACGGAARMATCRSGDETGRCASADTTRMKRIAGGTARLGLSADDAEAGLTSATADVERVTRVKEFWLDTTEVTAGDFRDWCDGVGRTSETCRRARALEASCSFVSGRRDLPMNCVDWFDANAYCAAQGKRLPSSEEWEYAARGRSAHAPFPWGASEPSGDQQLCWSGSAAREAPCPVASFPAGQSRDGLADLAGNVVEWTSSAWRSPSDRSTTTDFRVLRGGGYDAFAAMDVRAAYVYEAPPSARSVTVGFRCAR